VLLVSYHYPPDPSVGSQRWAAMAPHLRELGLDVTVLTTRLFGALPDDRPNVIRTADLRASPLLRAALRRPRVEEQAQSAAVPELLRSGLVPDAAIAHWLPFALAATRRRLRKERFDVIVTSNPPDSTHLLGLLLGSGRPAWIADFEDPWRFEPLRGPWPSRFQDRWDAAMEARVARSAEVLVSVSEPIAADFASRFGVDSRCITMAWDPALEPAVAAAKAPALAPGAFNLVHTGALTVPERRDPSVLFAALRRLSAEAPALAERLRLVIAGLLTDDERRALGGQGVEGLVQNAGVLGRADAVALQRSADALLLIATGSHRSQVTGKLFEYLAAGRPIIAIADENEAARIVRDTGTGVVVAPADLDGVVATLREALTSGLARHYHPHDLERYVFPAPALAFAEAVEAAVERRRARAGPRPD
jgi:glycosyltransferase involved in cell wall biosynthesis